MLEKETELIVQILTERTIGPREVITLRDVLEADIPKGVKTYIRADVTRWLKQGFRETPHYDRLGVAGPTSRQIVTSLVNSLAAEYAFERREYLAMIDNAVHFVENYLCRPHWTLEHFVFEQATVIDVGTLHEKLEYLAEYRYLGSILEQYIQSKRWQELHIDQFRSLLAKIESEVVQQHNAREIALLARPIYEFLLLGDVSPDRSIPIKPLLVFYEDKQLAILKDYLERVCQIRAREELSMNELSGIVGDLYLGVPRKSEQGPPEPAPHEDEHEAPVSHETESHNGAHEHPKEESAEVPSPAPRSTGNLALSLTFAGMNVPPSSPSPNNVLSTQMGLQELEAVISDEQRSVFVKRVFKRDEAYYAGVIAALNRITSWSEASTYLQELFQMNGLDPYAEEVIAFTDAIHHRYMPGRVRTDGETA